ncbi:methionyl-tRNA synthetase [Sulfobacillus thermosulfidooxidans DSM 9293]|uniref:Methionine--tRNA ligase n=1 Tax=Sulfobacillus thermosulfidooxidans (strain DSM 9293 / VKM B-1269 / AT-1) TaxID=929705 RepID=A0A1W1WAB2_SULTA|nr:methionine--tRNA ligase [Sulfobacillus thermosulfidooxidans]SMC03248.1 methionyl-tRNA synthetase [Sulfobacillus thermosulfidooxidans DSM 9293]
MTSGEKQGSTGQKVWYLTTPIYYPSDNLHIGHAYTTVAADALARFHRLKGEPVWFVTGTDEHGQKIAQKAQEAGKTPKEFVDGIVSFIRDPLWKTLGISYDRFIRTTDPDHAQVVQNVFEQLLAQGDIYKGTYEGWYCLPDETFWTESKLVDGKCPDCGRPVERVQQDSYFFKMSRYQDRMIEYILSHPDFIQPTSRRNEMLSFLESGLEDLSISRTGMSWGIPVPHDPEHVIYVWFDALVNYLTAAGYLEDPDKFARTWPPNVQLVGKEIVRFHTIIWPIILMALNLPLPERVFGHGWLLIGDTKMSKSRGNAVDPIALTKKYGVDAVRYYLLREVPFGADGSYTEDALRLRINVDLANDLGNLLSRTTAMINRFAQGQIPEPHPSPKEIDRSLAKLAAEIFDEVDKAMQQLLISDALTQIYRLIHAANKYIEDRAPWNLAKDPAQKEDLDNVLYNLAETLRIVSVLLTPFLIETPQKIRQQLGLTHPVVSYQEAIFGQLQGGERINRGDPLFPRLELYSEPEEDKEAGRVVSASPSVTGVSAQDSHNAPEQVNEITIEEFQKIDLRVGTIRHAEVVPNADRLLKLTVFDGLRERTIVSGIRAHYNPEQLIGQQVVLVANLKPVKLRGILSEGMLLAGSDNGQLSLVAPVVKLPEGARVK